MNAFTKIVLGLGQGLVFGIVIGDYLSFPAWLILVTIILVGSAWSFYLLEN